MNKQQTWMMIEAVKRVRRYILKALAVLSLLLAIATAGLWLLSFFQTYTGGYTWMVGGSNVQRSLTVGNHVRGLTIGTQESEAFPRAAGARYLGWGSSNVDLVGTYSAVYANHPYGSVHSFVGIQHVRIDQPSKTMRDGRRSTGITKRFTKIPHAYLIGLTSIMPALACRRMIRARCRPGHCPTCGYDMRANPARCSECGHEAVSKIG